MDSSSKPCVLVIEDDEDTRANLREILTRDGYLVATAATSAEGLDRAGRDEFLAIILDRRLPDALSGDILPELRRVAPEAAVIVVTGYADLEGAIAAVRQGAADYILKPLNPEALRASLGRIAERRRLARAKEHSDAAFRHLVEAAEAAIIILRPDRTVLYLSPFAERLTGYSAAEIRGRDVLDLFALDSPGGSVATELLQLGNGEALHGLEHAIRTREGETRWTVWNVRQLDDYESAPAILAVGQDITRLKQAQERSLQSERLAAIGQMVAGLTHESRNALQRSQACLEMLALEVQDRPAALALIERLQAAQDHLTFLYEDVGSYAAPLRLDRRTAPLPEVWRAAWAQVAPRGPTAAARLTESLECHDPRCQIDPFRLGQVFRNIFENSLAATGTAVEVAIRCTSATLRGRTALEITVRDNGPGLSPEARENIFEPFFTTKTKGTGLGMALARRIVEAHGGQIAVGTGPGPGAEILLTLPRGPS